MLFNLKSKCGRCCDDVEKEGDYMCKSCNEYSKELFELHQQDFDEIITPKKPKKVVYLGEQLICKL